jgi:predicted ribosome quality control (RQC) complex YloA/Tae2 family protein
MLSLIRNLFRSGTSYDSTLERLDSIESNIRDALDHFESTLDNINARLEKLEKIADENESLWQMLDEQREMDQALFNNNEDYNREIAEILLRNTKAQGDA